MRGSVAHQALYSFFSGLPKELGIERVGPDAARATRCPSCASCLDEAVARRADGADRAAAARARHGLWRDLEAFVSEDAAASRRSFRARFEVSFGGERAAPELQRGLELGEGSRSPGRSTGSTSTRSARAGSSRTTSRASAATRPRRSSRSSGCRSRSTCSSCATSSGSSRSAASTARSPASAKRAGCCARARARTACPDS